jgi:hypothetical protein
MRTSLRVQLQRGTSQRLEQQVLNRSEKLEVQLLCREAEALAKENQ